MDVDDDEYWRAALIINTPDAKYMDIGIQRLKALGFEHIHVFAAAGVTISQRYAPLVHQHADWKDGYLLWRGAIEIMGQVYSSRSMLFLVTRPNFAWIENFMDYCTKSIDPEIVGIWSPFTPDRLFPTSRPVRPVCTPSPGMGWCPTKIHSDASVAQALIFTRHMLTLTHI